MKYLNTKESIIRYCFFLQNILTSNIQKLIQLCQYIKIIFAQKIRKLFKTII